jgi:SAM-dependent methyltransferase
MSIPLIDPNPPEWLTEVVRCPRCEGRVDKGWRCVNLSCGLGAFHTAANKAPILIDFEQSAIDEQTVRQVAAPGVKRDGMLRRWLKPLAGLTNGAGGVTAMEHAAALLKDKIAPRVLMVGGGERWEGLDRFLALVPTAQILNSDVYPGACVHVITDAHQLAFASESFDIVILQAVIEHLIEPPVAVEHVWRVLKRDGLVLADTPFLQAVHMAAYDFTRYTPLGQRALFKRFEEIEVGISAGPMSALRWAIEHAAKSLFRTKVAAWMLRPLTLPLGWIEQFSPSNGYALDACSGSYFIGRKSDQTMSAREIVAAYRGAQ